MKKQAILILLTILINILLIQAINLDVSSKKISDSYIIELDEPAVYELTIKNLEAIDKFNIYSLVGIDITHDPTTIFPNQTKKVIIELTPQNSLKSNQLPFTFEYKIANSKNEIQKETLSINILKLDSAFLITPEPINPNSKEILLTVKNNIFYDFLEINLKATSAFFNQEENLSLNPKEKK